MNRMTLSADSVEWRVKDENGHRKPVSELTSFEVGITGEDLACAYLESRGYEILTRNWRKFGGEADIIAKDEDTVVIVEVKTRVERKSERGAIPELAVDKPKRLQYRKIALGYLSEHIECDSVRMDVIAVTLSREGRGQIRHLLGAVTWDD